MTPALRTLLVLALALPAAPLITALVAPPAAAAPARFGWPLAPPHPVARPFRAPATPYGPGHRGVDLVAPPGSPVLAAGDAVVAHAAVLAGRPVVSLLHAGGLRTTYEPVRPAVRAGERVRRGDPIGTLLPGHQGCPTAACLHWGAVRSAGGNVGGNVGGDAVGTAPRGREYLDPLRLLNPSRVRLLPVSHGRASGARSDGPTRPRGS